MMKILLLFHVVSAFVVQKHSYRRRSTEIFSGAGDDDGQVGQGPNWIERSFPVDIDEKVDPKKVEDYNLRVDGKAFEVGPLSKRMYDAIISRSSLDTSDPDIKKALKLYAMDFTAKEAVRAALTQNGLEMVLLEEEQDEGLWADIDSIQFNDMIFDSWEDAVESWTPGEHFSFIARQVPAKMRELTVEELLQALDPKGELRQEAKEAGMALADEDLISLIHVANNNVRRTEISPRETNRIFTGTDRRGYRPIHASALAMDARDGDKEKYETMMHIMEALVAHGCLLVDLTNGGTNFDSAIAMSKMWTATKAFFDAAEKKIPGMQTVEGAGSRHAKVGYASYENMEFLETRWDRSGKILPSEVEAIIGSDGVQALRDAFDCVAEIAKDVTRIAVAASSVEFQAQAAADASKSAVLLAKELLDDRIALSTDVDHSEGHVCMSPQRLCLYSNRDTGSSESNKEIFGAHTDSSFITAVPVASVAGLEVLDEDENLWYRPEAAARIHWESVTGSKEKIEVQNGQEIPWHTRYLVLMPGELLQLATRNEVLAAVHRVVASSEGPSRMSAPILIRGRSGLSFDVKRYLGDSMGNPLLEECDGMSIEQIHDAMQPDSFQ